MLLIIIASCTPEEEKIEGGAIQPLVFSTDSIIFDTIFTQVGSVSKRLIVKNPNKRAVNISNMVLGSGDNSPYSFYLDGVMGKGFEDEVLFGGDSLLIIVEVFIDPGDENLPFLVKDSLNFKTNNIDQDVKLISYGQDANFLFDSVLACNTVWDSPKPYVISNSILVDTLCTLTIKKDVKIYSDFGSFIFVLGSLIVEGEVDSPVIISNTRFDESYKNAPGQWEGLVFLPGSTNNQISNAIIRNAIIGLRINTTDEDNIPEVIVNNTVIENMSNSGILSFGSDVRGTNLLIDNCAQFLAAGLGGGLQEFIHCTFSNASSDFFHQSPSMAFTDSFVDEDFGIFLEGDLNFTLVNSIVWGNLSDELLINTTENTSSAVLISNSLIKTGLPLDINENILNVNPKFVSPSLYDFRLDTLSPAKDKGQPTSILLDISGAMRDDLPDIGAYERIEN